MYLVILFHSLNGQRGPSVNKHPARLVEITPCHMFHSPLLSPGTDPVTGGRLPYRYGKQQFEQNVSNNGRQGRRITEILSASGQNKVVIAGQKHADIN